MRNVTRIVLTTGCLLMGSGARAGQGPVRPAILIRAVPPAPGPPLSPLPILDRLVSFDANKDRLISRNELPERMLGLVARGDKNADGALDSEEIGMLVMAASSERTRIVFRTQPFDGLSGVISDLKLAPEKHARALAIVSAHQVAPGVEGLASSDLHKEMRALLDSEEYENFAAAAARLARNPQFRILGGTVGGVQVRPGGR